MPPVIIINIALLVVVGCANKLPPSIEEIQLATVPVGVDKQEIFINQDTIAQVHQLGQQNMGGFSIGIFATYEELIQDEYSSFFVPYNRPFMGKLWVWNNDNVAHKFVIICQLNYIQIPCAPDFSIADFRDILSNQDFFLPIEINSLIEGMQDLEILVIKDPFVELETNNSRERLSTDGSTASASLYVDETYLPQNINPLIPEIKKGPIWDAPFFISKLSDPYVNNNSIQIWLDEIATVNDVLSFFIHLGGADDPEDHNVVFSAFLNYEQIPLIVNGQPQFPLYLFREAKTWQFTPVSVQLPDKPGDYEFVLVAREYPHSYFEIDGEYVGKAFTEFSQRIRVSVNP